MDVSAFENNFTEFENIDFLLIDDRSEDQTFSTLKSFQKQFSNVSTIQKRENSGKAESIRFGVHSLDKKYPYIGYLDADLATPVPELINLLKEAKTHGDKKIIMGTRIKLLGNHVKRSLKRHYFGRIFATLISQFVLKIPVYDTQCGAKIIEGKLAVELFEKPFTTKWLFDVELLLRFRAMDKNFTEKVKEIPLETWTEKGGSKIKWYEFLQTPFQMIKLYARYR